jgi:hypothetical protein
MALGDAVDLHHEHDPADQLGQYRNDVDQRRVKHRAAYGRRPPPGPRITCDRTM